MLAPRKTLWSTPDSVIDTAFDWIGGDRLESPSGGGVICDIGCGDGRVLLKWAELYSSQQQLAPRMMDPNQPLPSFIGIDIDETRIAEANEGLKIAKEMGKIDARLSVQFHCRNALEAVDLFQNATVFFLYLIPRGLRIVYPILQRVVENSKHDSLQVVTYMSPLPNEKPLRRELIAVPHQPGAAWPLFLYRLEKATAEESPETIITGKEDGCDG